MNKREPLILLRDMTQDDLPIFFEQMQDATANRMAAFTAKDPFDHAAFLAHWNKNLGNENTTNKTIVFEGQVAGHVLSFQQFGNPEISYWLGREYWGKGIATAALTKFLPEITPRPLYARAVKDNLGSLRVLEKCGFLIVGEDTGFSNARNTDVEEFVLELSA